MDRFFVFSYSSDVTLFLALILLDLASYVPDLFFSCVIVLSILNWSMIQVRFTAQLIPFE